MNRLARTTALLSTAVALTVGLLPTGASAQTPADCSRQPSDPLASYEGRVISAGSESSPITLEEAVPGSTFRILAYTQPDTTYRVVRTYQQQPGGRYVTALRPPRNTRFKVELLHPDCGTRISGSQVVRVSPTLSISAVRNGTRDYTFSGRMSPVREGKIVNLYREISEFESVLAAQARVQADGTYRFRRTFSQSGAWNFYVESGNDSLNWWGYSPFRYTVVH